MASKFTLSKVWSLARATFSNWSADKAPKMSGALACYTILSVAPLLVVTQRIVALEYGTAKAADRLHAQLAKLTDPHVADALSLLIPHHESTGGTVAAVLSLLVAFFGASSMFAELQDSLNIIWEVRPKPGRGLRGIIYDRFLSLAMVFGIVFLLLVTMVVSSFITGGIHWAASHLGSQTGWLVVAGSYAADLLVSTAVVTALFAAMFKVLPDAEIRWSDVWLGAGVTAVLFQLGKYGLSLYIGLSKPGVAYGLAGSLVVVLVWIYYSAWILFLGAEFTRVYANKYGSTIVPSGNAEPLTPEMQAQIGVVHQPSHA